MKSSFTLIVILGCLNFSSCNLFSGGDEPKTELEKLPPPTQTGKNTFGCLVNGKAMVAKSSVDLVAIYQGGGIQIGGHLVKNGLIQNILMIVLDPIEAGVEYDLTNLPDKKVDLNSKLNDLPTCYYEFENTYEGSIIFSKIDRTNFIVSGTFEFSTVTVGCDTVRITDGRFDIQYIP